MNREAKRHLDKAEGYLAKGEENYRKAASEMRKAKDAGATWTEIGDALGRSTNWCQKVVAWAESPANGASAPFAEKDRRDSPDVRGAKRILAEAPLEQIEQIISSLPTDRQQAIGAAAGHRYSQMRQRFDEEQARQAPRTPAEAQAQAAQQSAADEAFARVVSPIEAVLIDSLLDEATEKLREMVEAQGVTPGALDIIERALDAFITEFQVARGMAGLDSYERSGA